MSHNKHKAWNPATLAIHGGHQREAFGSLTTPLYQTATFVFDNAEQGGARFAGDEQGYIYTRLGNPTTAELERKMALLEGAEDAAATASGMAAVFSTFAALLNSGDHVISARNIFGSTHSLFMNFLPKWNITSDYFEIDDLEAIDALVKPTTKFIYAESPTNPGVDILDLEALGKIAKRHNLLLIIDNCFATPYLQQPIKFGADLVIHSGTKLMDGQGRVLAGITVGSAELIDKVYRFSRITGPALSPFNAWVISKSLETLAVRVDRHCENALKLAMFLESHPKVNWVKYPFLKSHPMYKVAKKQMKAGGTIVAFEVKGGLDAGRKFFDGIKLLSLSANLGDSRSIVTHPASTTHSKLSTVEREAVNITDGTVRVSVGLEHIDDIISDIKQALA